MELFDIVSFAAIVVICYALGEIIKATPLDKKFIPAILFVAGGVLGAVAYFAKIPKFPAEDVFTAIAVGIVSALASTGVNQLIKQIRK
jgi:energy-converting hydrogenase Eha subunit C